MGSARQRPRPRALGTVLGRLVLAASLILLPIFTLGIVGFLQLDRHSERFSEVAAEAAQRMRLVERLLTDFDDADEAAEAYLEDGDRPSLVRFDRIRPRIDAGLTAGRRLDQRLERTQAAEATRRWETIKARVRLSERLRDQGRAQPQALVPGHNADLTVAEGQVVDLLDSSQAEIDAEVAAGREQRNRDRWLLALQIALGLLLAAWVMHRLAREAVRPLARLGAAADRLRAGHLDERVAIEGPAELAHMGATFNVMAGTLEAQQEELRRLAYSDALTGLPNRVAFLERVEAATAAEHHAGVLFVDLDDFKSVNDALGHAAGDELLVEVARRIESAVGPTGSVARLGGDEFAVLLFALPAEEDAAAAVAVADRVLAALAVPLTVAGVELVPSGSLGIATGASDAAELLRNADTAMYEAKRAGRHRHAVFRPEMQAAAVERLAGTADLRQALEGEELRLVYQPIVDLQTSAVRATEALVRWQHPERGLVSPAEFIPLAEQTGLIVGIGGWVLREACRQAAAWQAMHPDAGRGMAVNLSTRQLLEPELVDQVRSALADAALPPDRLLLEITESAVMADPPAAIARLTALRELGVRLAIDDFGTGHSSLAYLRELPVDELKIAGEFVAGLEESPHDLALARGILSLGHGLGLRVVAEGIETDAQHARLRGMGCDLGQGYLYARPLEAAAIGPLLARAVPAPVPPAPGFVATASSDRVFRDAWHRLPDVSVLTFDSELRITMADGLGLERMGWRPQELEGRRLGEVLPPERAEELELAWRWALRGQRHRLEWPTVRAGRRLALDIGPIRDGDGGLRSGMMVARDVTDDPAALGPGTGAGAAGRTALSAGA